MLRKITVAVYLLLSSMVASAVTVSIVPGKEVGIHTDSSFWGLITVNVDGKEMLAMVDQFDYEILTPWWYTDATPWETNLYSQDDILSGAVVNYSPERYSKAAVVFIQSLLGYYPADPLWTTGHNEMIWDIVRLDGSYPAWVYADYVYDQTTGTTLHDLYNSMLPLDPNFDYRGSVMILSSPWASNKEMLVYATAIPIPSALWLLGSGLLGLVAVSRQK